MNHHIVDGQTPSAGNLRQVGNTFLQFRLELGRG